MYVRICKDTQKKIISIIIARNFIQLRKLFLFSIFSRYFLYVEIEQKYTSCTYKEMKFTYHSPKFSLANLSQNIFSIYKLKT